MSPLVFRKRITIGPVVLHLNGWRITSWSLRAGDATWNSKRGGGYNLPGPWSWKQKR
jgi:hypothetical protein